MAFSKGFSCTLGCLTWAFQAFVGHEDNLPRAPSGSLSGQLLGIKLKKCPALAECAIPSWLSSFLGGLSAPLLSQHHSRSRYSPQHFPANVAP